MAHRVLEVTLQSAKDLKNVNLLTRMEVYAVATISGDPITRQCTPPDPYGGRHPSWNAALRFTVPPTAASASGCLHVLLRTERALGDRDVGEVIVPLSELLAGTSTRDLGPRPPKSASYPVRKVHRAETRGVLHLSYRLGPVVAPQEMCRPRAVADEHVVAGYPVARPFHPQPAYTYLPALAVPPSPRPSGHGSMPPPSPQSSGHASMPPPSPQASGGLASMPPTPRQASGHMTMPTTPRQASGHMTMPTTPRQASEHMTMPPTPPPKSYGHFSMPPPPPPLQSSGHIPAPSTPPKTVATSSPWTANNNGRVDFGMGLSAGLVGGAIGGMMAGDMMSDAAAYNAGYRAGLTSEWGKTVY